MSPSPKLTEAEQRRLHRIAEAITTLQRHAAVIPATPLRSVVEALRRAAMTTVEPKLDRAARRVSEPKPSPIDGPEDEPALDTTDDEAV